MNPGTTALGADATVVMKPPAHPTRGVVVESAPLLVGGVRYWRVAWMFGGEKRLTWSPESSLLAC
ncbi:MAG: hypothetical protein ACLPYS_01745 [Vulcanimicrobiaceae bacterium]